ncbi:MAG: hypothetical protein KDI05_14110, partial [Halieaceae bacterium]|nr:hypothetical protein [Halieaceae bacterium]
MTSKKQNLGNKAVGKSTVSIGNRLRVLVGALVMTIWAGSALAEPTITDIEFSSRPGSKFEIRMDFDQPPP